MAKNQDLLHVATRAAERAAAFIRTAERPDPAFWDRKARSDFVTEVDRRAERLIAETLLEAVPDSVVLGEELSPEESGSALRWIVDPLDGTTNFLHGYPAYAVSIAAAVGDEPVAAVVNDVSRGVTYTAVAGEGAGTGAGAGAGAWCNGAPLRVSSLTEPAKALLGTGFPFKQPASEHIEQYLRQLAQLLSQTGGIRRAGSAAIDLAHVAEGRLEGFWELWLAPWDMAAGILLVREAGGVVTDLAGRPASLAAGPIVAGNPTIHEWLLGELNAIGT